MIWYETVDLAKHTRKPPSAALSFARTAIGNTIGMKRRQKMELDEDIVIAEKIVNRAERGLPQDRWMRGDAEQLSLVRAYTMTKNALFQLHQEMIKRGSDAMDID